MPGTDRCCVEKVRVYAVYVEYLSERHTIHVVPFRQNRWGNE